MTGRDVANAAAVVAALVLGVLAANPGREPRPIARQRHARPAPVVELRALPDGGRGLVDATGVAVPLRDYRRIIAGSTVARELLVALAERDRIAAVVDYGLDNHPWRHRYDGIEHIATVTDVERVVSLAPDLILVHGLRDPARVTRLREAGFEVFDLGQMRGRMDLIPNVHQIAALLGDPARGARYAATWERRMAAVAADVPRRAWPTAIYASIYGNRIFGGTTGSSFADIVAAAGLVDGAAGRYRGWPRYSAEDLLVLDPERIVTNEGMGERLCGQPELDRLRACRDGRRGVVEMPRGLLTAPGPRMLEAAELLREQVHGPPGR